MSSGPHSTTVLFSFSYAIPNPQSCCKTLRETQVDAENILPYFWRCGAMTTKQPNPNDYPYWRQKLAEEEARRHGRHDSAATIKAAVS